MGKTFLEITAKHDIHGHIIPLSLQWTDGRVFSIDRILDVRTAASLKAGGQGTRYTCRIQGKKVMLFCDQGQWFVEN